jgi:hypothetical protein
MMGATMRSWITAIERLLAEVEGAMGATAADSARLGVQEAPIAAGVLADVLLAADGLDMCRAVTIESLAYSALLAGPEFAAWRAVTPRRGVVRAVDPVLVGREGSVLRVTLNQPGRRNAWGVTVRDQFLDALLVAEADINVDEVRWDATGPSFCAGGDLDEFGTAKDPATAHQVRMSQHAGLAVHAMRDRVRPRLHGVCIGAGIEIPAFAAHVTARANTTFRLPEVAMGLIPGAGGTASITRRIGLPRAAWLFLTGTAITAPTALDWGLVDEVTS